LIQIVVICCVAANRSILEFFWVMIRIWEFLTEFLPFWDTTTFVRILEDQLPWRRFPVSGCF